MFFIKKKIFKFLWIKFIISLIFSLLCLYLLNQKNKKNVYANIDELIKTTIPTLTRAIAYEDDQHIETYLNGVIGHKDIVYLELTRVYENVIDEKPEYQLGKIKKENDLIQTIDLRFQRENENVSFVGRLSYTIKYSDFFTTIKSHIKLILLIFVTFLVVMPLAYSFIYEKIKMELK